mgnify:CR=1 FL=1
MNKYFVIGDVHGCYEKLVALLKSWNPKEEKLIFLGDLIDRGTGSLEVVQLAIKLVKEYDAVVIRGNHEELFINWLLYPETETEVYLAQGGDKTAASFTGIKDIYQYSSEYLTRHILENFIEEASFLEDLPFYYYDDSYIFVHAGIDTDKIDWKKTREHDFCWIRERFYSRPNETNHTIIFGHTPTRKLNVDKSHDVWVSPCKTKIGIDGEACAGGRLHALRIHGKNIKIISA